MTENEPKPKRWRPWRFSLRLLLLATFGVSMFFASWTANDRVDAFRRMRSGNFPWVPPNPSPRPPVDALIELRGPPAIEIDLSQEAVKETNGSNEAQAIDLQELP